MPSAVAERASKMLDLLYLQAASTSVGAPVIGTMFCRDGRLDQGPADADS